MGTPIEPGGPSTKTQRGKTQRNPKGTPSTHWHLPENAGGFRPPERYQSFVWLRIPCGIRIPSPTVRPVWKWLKSHRRPASRRVPLWSPPPPLVPDGVGLASHASHGLRLPTFPMFPA